MRKTVSVFLALVAATVLLLIFSSFLLWKAVGRSPTMADWHRERSWHRYSLRVDQVSNSRLSSAVTSATTHVTAVPGHSHDSLPGSTNGSATSRITVDDDGRQTTWPNKTSGMSKKRATDLHMKCEQSESNIRTHPYTTRSVYSRLIVNEKHGLLYCPIEKVGSSFWKRVFHILNQVDGWDGESRNTSVFDLSGVEIHHVGGLKKASRWLQERRPGFFQTASSFLFVRDPYERLFSGFVDKIFTPTFETSDVVLGILRTRAFTKQFGPFGRSGQYARRGGPDIDHHLYGRRSVSEAIPRESEEHTREARRLVQGYEEEQPNVVEAPEILQVSDRNTKGNERAERQRVDFNGSVLHGSEDTDNETRGKGKNSDLLVPDSERSRLLRRRLLSKQIHSFRSCPRSVTFADFVRHVIEGLKVNPHFQPMSRACPPCVLPYRFLGKMETFKEDVHDILTAAGVDPSSVLHSEASFDHDSDLNILRDVTTRTFSVIKKYRRCMTQAEMLSRTWTTFQIRGLLSINQSLPLTEKESNEVTKDDFLTIVQRAFRLSGPRHLRMRQRKVAMLEAFYSLPRSLLKHLERHVTPDCRLFGYECSVEERFNANSMPERLFHFQRLMETGFTLEQ